MPRVSVYNPVELRALALEIFDRTFKITDIVGIIAMVLALVGFVFTAMQLALERKAIIQTVLTIGARLSQAAKMLWFFYLAQVIIAGCLGVVIGGILGWVLAEVINPRYFGWSVEFRLDGAVFTGVPMYMLLACLSIAATAAILEIYGRGFLGSNPEIE
jgi:putative ABC transport system permease protein